MSADRLRNGYDHEFIVARRKHLGYSQADVVRLLTSEGVPAVYQTTLSRIENGTARLSFKLAIALAAALQCEPRDLIGESSGRKILDESAYRAGYLAGLRDARNAVAALDGSAS